MLSKIGFLYLSLHFIKLEEIKLPMFIRIYTIKNILLVFNEKMI